VTAQVIGEDVAAFSETFSRLMRSAMRTRQQFLAAAKHNVEWSASVIINCVACGGPIRTTAIAEVVQSDPSTVSRQVASLVNEGLLERRADPVDGRASLLVITPKGEAAYREIEGVRNEHFAGMLSGWSERDLRRFTALLRRFTDDYETYRPQFFAVKNAASGEES
jgi:DNA-binding MarR family transcriptional regulator